jgi:TolB protein
MKKIIFLFFAFLLSVSGVSYAQNYELNITNPNYQKILINVYNLESSNPVLAQKVKSVIVRDLNIAGFYQVNDINTTISNPSSVSGCNYAFFGSVNESNGNVVLDAKVYNVTNQKIVINTKITSNNFAWVSHKLVDNFMLYDTGIYGPFESKIIFSAGNHKVKNLYIADFDGENIQQITHYNSNLLLPMWVTNDEVSFTGYLNKYPSAYLLNLSNGHITHLSSNSNFSENATYYKDGLYAVSINKDSNINIFLVNKSGQIVKQLTNNHGITISPYFTPSLSKMIYVSNSEGSPQIYSLDLSLGVSSRLTYDCPNSQSPAVSPDGTKIAYICAGSNFALNIIGINGGNSENIISSYYLDSPSWSYDSRYVAVYGSIDSKEGIYIINTINGNFSLAIGTNKLYSDFGGLDVSKKIN